jgi:hypothetical protein
VIKDVAALLTGFREREVEAMQRSGITHAPTFGAQYEGVSGSVLKMMIPPELALQVVSGFVEGINGMLSGQIDGMLVRGSGPPIPSIEGQYKWPIKDVLAVLEVKKTLFGSDLADAQKYKKAGIVEQVMLSFTTDPYHPGDTNLTRQTLEILIEHGLGFCTLKKDITRARRDLDLFRSDRDAFASTLTSLDDAFSRKWEASAALPGDRIAALRRFHEAGIFTWVSLEPTLDVESSMEIVRQTHSFVDLFKIGRVNYLPMTKTTDWRDYTLRMIDLCHRLGVQHYVEKDLQPYLPAGHRNPLRVRQSHGESEAA